jgi:hypothetical protein
MPHPIVIRIEKLSSRAQIGARSAHNHRDHAAASSDPLREDWNQLLLGSDDTLADVEAALAAVDGPIRSNAVLAVEMIITANAEWFRADAARTDAFRDRCMEQLQERYGDRLVSAIYHLDEDAPHMHAVIVPTETKPRGQVKLNARGEFGGPAALRGLQDWGGRLGAPLGLKRGVPRSYDPEIAPAEYKSPNRHRAELQAKEVALAAREAELAEREMAIQSANDEISRNQEKMTLEAAKVTAAVVALEAYAFGEIVVTRDQRLGCPAAVPKARQLDLMRQIRPGKELATRLVVRIAEAVRDLPAMAQEWYREHIRAAIPSLADQVNELIALQHPAPPPEKKPVPMLYPDAPVAPAIDRGPSFG